MIVPLSLLSTLLISTAWASNVLELVPDNFELEVGKGRPGLVEFFAPWCGHCKNLAPIYEQLADVFAHAKNKVLIAKVDADGEGRELGQKYGVKGFPTLKWFDGEGNAETYEGARDLEALALFVTSKSGVKSSIKPPAPPVTTVLTAENFDKFVMDEDKDVLVAFTAPWCGHCKKMKPEFEKVAEIFKTESSCAVANVDADADENASLAQKYSIRSFPTLKFFPKGNKEGEDYKGGRTEADFIEFLNSHCGTNRKVGGGLNDLAGRIPEFDSLASKFFTAATDAKNGVYQEAMGLAGAAGKTSQHYLKVMQKVINGSEEYFQKESSRLASILKKNTVQGVKRDEIKIKANILAAFAEEKVEELKEAGEAAAESVESAAHKLKEEL